MCPVSQWCRAHFSSMREDFRVSVLAASNLALAGVGNFLDKLGQILHLLLTFGQVGVATITIIYIWKKIRALGKRK